jgi:hypothetical protein
MMRDELAVTYLSFISHHLSFIIFYPLSIFA